MPAGIGAFRMAQYRGPQRLLFGRGVTFDLAVQLTEQLVSLAEGDLRFDHREQRAMPVMVFDEPAEDGWITAKLRGGCAPDMDGRRGCNSLGFGEGRRLGQAFNLRRILLHVLSDPKSGLRTLVNARVSRCRNRPPSGTALAGRP